MSCSECLQNRQHDFRGTYVPYVRWTERDTFYTCHHLIYTDITPVTISNNWFDSCCRIDNMTLEEPMCLMCDGLDVTFFYTCHHLIYTDITPVTIRNNWFYSCCRLCQFVILHISLFLYVLKDIAWKLMYCLKFSHTKPCVLVCGSYVVHHFVGTGLHLRCALSACTVHHRPVWCTMVDKGDLTFSQRPCSDGAQGHGHRIYSQHT